MLLGAGQGSLHIFLTNEPLHRGVYVVGVARYRRLFVVGVVALVGGNVAHLFHVLKREKSVSVPAEDNIGHGICAYLDLLVGPTIHAQ